MKNQILNNSTKDYLIYCQLQRHLNISKVGKIRLDLAEGLFHIPENFSKNISTLKICDYSSLPDRDCKDLKCSISKFLKVKSENLSIFSGSDEIIEIIPRMYLQSGDASLSIVPTFSRLIDSSRKVGAKIELFKLGVDSKFKLNLKTFINLNKTIKSVKPKVVWLCTPNNPTGIITSLDKIQLLAKRFPDTLFVINEVYQEYYSLNPKKSAVSLISTYSNLLVIRSFSKAFGLAGARIGYVVGSSSRISEFEKFRTMYNTSIFGQKLAIEALCDNKYVSRMTEFVRNEKDMLLKTISKDCNNIDFVAGSETNLILLRHRNKDIFQKLYKKGVIVSDWRTSNGINNLGYVRISIGEKIENQKLIKLLKEIN